MLTARFRLGLFDPPDKVPFAQIPLSENDTPEHEALALKVAQESIVLLKNNGVLPLDRAKIKRIAVIGTNANSVPMLLGNYNGTPSQSGDDSGRHQGRGRAGHAKCSTNPAARWRCRQTPPAKPLTETGRCHRRREIGGRGDLCRRHQLPA